MRRSRGSIGRAVVAAALVAAATVLAGCYNDPPEYHPTAVDEQRTEWLGALATIEAGADADRDLGGPREGRDSPWQAEAYRGHASIRVVEPTPGATLDDLEGWSWLVPVATTRSAEMQANGWTRIGVRCMVWGFHDPPPSERLEVFFTQPLPDGSLAAGRLIVQVSGPGLETSVATFATYHTEPDDLWSHPALEGPTCIDAPPPADVEADVVDGVDPNVGTDVDQPEA